MRFTLPRRPRFEQRGDSHEPHLSRLVSPGPAARPPARVRPLAWGCTAALVGTLASNAFYLTMQFYYFYAFVALALAIPVVFAQRE